MEMFRREGSGVFVKLFNILDSEKMPEEWRKSVLVLILKNKVDTYSCSNYRGLKLISHSMRIWHRVVEVRLRDAVMIFFSRKISTNAMSFLRIWM